jgi:hypothetical protein
VSSSPGALGCTAINTSHGKRSTAAMLAVVHAIPIVTRGARDRRVRPQHCGVLSKGDERDHQLA